LVGGCKAGYRTQAWQGWSKYAAINHEFKMI
jgi:hypothetical protein